jgi:hypothetical protein
MFSSDGQNKDRIEFEPCRLQTDTPRCETLNSTDYIEMFLCIYFIVYHHHMNLISVRANCYTGRKHYINVAYKPFEYAAKIKYFERTLTNQYCIREDVGSSLYILGKCLLPCTSQPLVFLSVV